MSGMSRLEILIFDPHKCSVEVNFHILYLYGLMIENINAVELLEKMMPKLGLYLSDLEL